LGCGRTKIKIAAIMKQINPMKSSGIPSSMAAS
jgi:hypothetical protein